MEIQTVNGMINHNVVSKEEWDEQRKALLKAEKEWTKHGDEVTKQRLALPWVKIDKAYRFDTAEGNVSFADLFKDRSQLLIYHFMFGPEYEAGCPHCSAIADGFNGVWKHLANHDVILWAVSRAPFDKLKAFRKRMKWTFPWASSNNSDFNYDFNVSFTPEQQRSGNLEYNYNKGNVASKQSNINPNDTAPEEGKKIAATTGTDWATYTQEGPGMSAFALYDGVIYHTYSSFARGLDSLWGVYQWLDRAPLGRNENGFWMRRHDEYNINKNNTDSCCS